jgi:biotin transport system substrate-specific component
MVERTHSLPTQIGHLGSHPLRLCTAAGAALMIVTASAYASLPLPLSPVPLTLQSLAVLMVGAWGGPRLGATVCATYVLLGLMGFPVFAGGSSSPGLAVLLRPTAGYLLAFAPAAFVAGLVWRHGAKSWLSACLALTAGHIIIFSGGVAWLSIFLGPSAALAAGLTPFLLGTAIKIALGTALLIAMRSKPARAR